MSGELISRQAIFEQIYCWLGSGEYRYTNATDYLMERIRDIPSVTPQEPNTGHWIEKDGYDGDTYYDCSECGESWSTIDGTPWNNGMKYCPNCGCRMFEPQESEEG